MNLDQMPLYLHTETCWNDKVSLSPQIWRSFVVELWFLTLVASLLVCKTFWPISAPFFYGVMNLILQGVPKWMSSILLYIEKYSRNLCQCYWEWPALDYWFLAILLLYCWKLLVLTTTLQLQTKVKHLWNCEAFTDGSTKLRCHSHWPEKMQLLEDIWKRVSFRRHYPRVSKCCDRNGDTVCWCHLEASWMCNCLKCWSHFRY